MGVVHFNTLIPYPEEYRKQDQLAEQARKADPPDYSVKDGYNSGGYEWCIRNWGTKWNGGEMTPRGENAWTFDTPWAPPIPIIHAFIRKFPDLGVRLEYYEGGMGFCGRLEYDPENRSELDEDPVASCIEYSDHYDGERGG